MKKNSVLLNLMVVFAFFASPASAIIGGEPDFEHNNVGAIMMVWPQFEDIVGRLCSGTLIHPRALLTAAHCYEYIQNQEIGFDQVWVTFDQDPFSDEATLLNVVDFIPHQGVPAGGGHSSDIGLVILADPYKKVEPLLLPAIGFMDDLLKDLSGKERQDLELNIVGYGNSEFLSDPPDVQLDAVRKSGTVSFDTLLPFDIRTTNSDPDNVQACNGDSGSPQFYLDPETETEVLVGVLKNLGFGCTSPMLHLRVDKLDVQGWIQLNLPEDK